MNSALRHLGIDPRQFCLLTGLFKQLSDRREILNQLGHDGVTLKSAAWMYFVLSTIGGLLFAAAHPAAETYLRAFLFVTAFVLLGILLAETGNSLVNATEGLILAHQPINGVTYTAAKLLHLLRILLYFVPGLNTVPALAGLLLRNAGWTYPLEHMAATFGAGIAVALVCCSIYGWLIRFVPAARLKAAGQIAESLPMLGLVFLPRLRELPGRLHLLDWIQANPSFVRYGSIAAGMAGIAIVVMGLRSLSADFLVRVSTIVQSGPTVRARPGGSKLSNLVARFLGGPSSRAGFVYLSRMLVRDYQFRRGLIPLLPAVVLSLGGALAGGWAVSPFSGQFTPIHLMPHVFGFLLFWVCSLIPYGSHYQGAWMFLLVPSGSFHGFARGICAMFWLRLIAIPHVLLFLVVLWPWGLAGAVLFTAFSLAVSSLYLGLNLRQVEGVPFTKQPRAARNAFLFPLMMLAGLLIAAAVGLQHFLLFRSAAAVVISTAVVGAVAALSLRSAVSTFEASMRYHLALVQEPPGALFQEVEI
jgi:hypothetical protein